MASLIRQVCDGGHFNGIWVQGRDGAISKEDEEIVGRFWCYFYISFMKTEYIRKMRAKDKVGH